MRELFHFWAATPTPGNSRHRALPLLPCPLGPSVTGTILRKCAPACCTTVCVVFELRDRDSGTLVHRYTNEGGALGFVRDVLRFGGRDQAAAFALAEWNETGDLLVLASGPALVQLEWTGYGQCRTPSTRLASAPRAVAGARLVHGHIARSELVVVEGAVRDLARAGA